MSCTSSVSHHRKLLIGPKKSQTIVTIVICDATSSFAVIMSLSVPRYAAAPYTMCVFCWGLPIKLLSCWPFSDGQLLCQGSWFSLLSRRALWLYWPVRSMISCGKPWAAQRRHRFITANQSACPSHIFIIRALHRKHAASTPPSAVAWPILMYRRG